MSGGKGPTHILLVDDEPMITGLFSTILQNAGYEVLVASDGREGLEKLQQDPSAIDVLVTDVDMPSVSGIELARLASANQIPVILISGKPSPPETANQSWDYLAKPFAPDLLLKAIGRAAPRSGADEKPADGRRARVLVAEDDVEVRKRLVGLLDAEADCEVVAAVGKGEEALQKAEQLHPDVILLDITMPGMNGFVVARKLRQTMPSVPLLFVTQHSEPIYVEEAFAAGGTGYLLKRNISQELSAALHKVRSGARYLSPGLSY